MQLKKLLLVDDDEDLREALSEQLVMTEDFDVFEASDGASAMERVKDSLFDLVKSESDGIDVLFANAGLGSVVPLGEITEEHFDGIFDVNVKGTLFTVQKALPLMKKGGSIIMTGSTTGSMGTPAFSVYSASKAAIRNFARVWAQDLRGTGIRINVLSPGATETDALLDITGKEGADAMSQMMPLERLGKTSELAAVAAFLASDDSSFMTGSEVFADGGQAQI